MKTAFLLFANIFFYFTDLYENYRAFVHQAEVDLVKSSISQTMQNNISEVSKNVSVEIIHSVGVGC